MTDHELEVLDTIGTSEYLDFQMSVDNGTVLVLSIEYHYISNAPLGSRYTFTHEATEPRRNRRYAM